MYILFYSLITLVQLYISLKPERRYLFTLEKQRGADAVEILLLDLTCTLMVPNRRVDLPFEIDCYFVMLFYSVVHHNNLLSNCFYLKKEERKVWDG